MRKCAVRKFYIGFSFHREYHPRIRLWSDYELRKTRRWTWSPQHKAGPFPGSILCPPPPLPFQLLCHFYTRVIAFFGLLHPPDERSIRKTRFPPFITYVRRPAAPGYRAPGKDDRDSMEWNYLSLLCRLQLHRRRYNNPLSFVPRSQHSLL